MTINLYSGFTKRINSTKVPSGSALTLSGNLKEPCSIENPVIPFEFNSSPAAYTYAFIQEFGRYYFIDDWTWNNGLWEASFREDYLASWKTAIGDTFAYIDRCSNTFDGDIVDTEYIAKTNFDNRRTFLNSPFYVPSNTSGCYIVGIVNGDSTLASQLGGSVTYYALEDYQMRALMAYLLSTSFLDDVGFPSVQSITQQLSQDTAKAFINPFQYIVSCVFYPLPVSSFASGNNVDIRVGYWTIQQSVATGKLLTELAPVFNVTGQLTQHPQAATRGNYLNFSPFTKVSFTIPPFGSFPIDLSYRTKGDHVLCKIYLDTITGKAQLFAYLNDGGQIVPSDDNPVYEATAVLGVPIQLAQINVDYISALPHIGEAIGAAAGGAVQGFITGGFGGAAAGAIGSALPSIASAITCLSPQVTTKGVDGSILYIYLQPRINTTFSLLVDEDNAEIGRPLRQIKKINTIPGYIKCFEVTIDYSCFATEKEAILNFMYSGFFYE